MITVNCSQCKAALEMDDAFAGGVCRCHYCGTIQAVPANARRLQAAPAVPAGGNGAARHAPPPARGDGLDALADAVASGSGRGALRSRPPPAPVIPVQPVDYARPTGKSPLLLILIALLVGVVMLLALGGVLFLGRAVGVNSPSTVSIPAAVTPAPVPAPVTPAPPPVGGSAGAGSVDPEPPPAIPKGPHFCDIKLDGAPGVVYVLDRGQATAELFDTLKEATYRSLESLKPGTTFQIVFWDNADAPAAYPADGMATVSPQEIEAARAQFADVIAGGRARADTAVQRAAKSEPAVIILVTGKAFDLDDALVQTVQSAAKGKTKVHTVALRSDDGNPVLKQIADKTHGEFRVVTGKELRDASY